MHYMQVTYMVKPPQVNLTQSSTESLTGNGTYINKYMWSTDTPLAQVYRERHMDWKEWA